MVGQRWLNALVAAAAVVLFGMVVVALMVFLATMATLMAFLATMATLMFSFTVAALVPRLVMVALVLREGVVVLRAAHGAGGEAVAELYATDAGNGEHGVGNL
jgi:hypothetical protein